MQGKREKNQSPHITTHESQKTKPSKDKPKLEKEKEILSNAFFKGHHYEWLKWLAAF